MIKKISTQQLIKGMYICGNDRKWLETPFLWSKFLLKTDSQIKQLQEYCHFVSIDTQKGLDLPDEVNPASSIHSAETLFRQAQQDYIDLLHTATTEQRIDFQQLHDIVLKLLEGLNRYPETILGLSLQTSPENAYAHRAIPICIQTLVLARHLQLAVERIQIIGQGALLASIGEEFSFRESNDNPTNCRLVNILNHLNRADAIIQNRQQAFPVEYKLNQLIQAVLVLVIEFNSLLGADGQSVDQVIGQMVTDYDELDSEILAHFLMAINCYPLHSVVELNTGALGLVVAVNPQQPEHPKLQVITDVNKQLLDQPMILNLADPLVSQHKIKTLLPKDEPIAVLLLDYLAQRNAASQGI